MRRYLYLLATLIVAAALVIIAMQSRQTEKPEAQLTVLCGSSFRYPAEKLIEMFEKESGIDMEISFGGSEDHLPHIQAKEAGDIYITHSPYMKYTEDANAASRWIQVGYVRPVLVSKKGNPFALEKVEDLAKSDLKVALPDANYSTCGEMVEKLFKEKGIWDDVKKNTENAFFRSHSQTATAIKMGNRDAGMMWNGVAHTWLDSLDIIPTPYEYDEVIEVGIVGLSYSKHPKIVEDFMKFSEENGKNIFSEFGYTK